MNEEYYPGSAHNLSYNAIVIGTGNKLKATFAQKFLTLPRLPKENTTAVFERGNPDRKYVRAEENSFELVRNRMRRLQIPSIDESPGLVIPYIDKTITRSMPRTVAIMFANGGLFLREEIVEEGSNYREVTLGYVEYMYNEGLEAILSNREYSRLHARELTQETVTEVTRAVAANH